LRARTDRYVIILLLALLQAGCIELDSRASENLARGAGDSATITASDSIFPASAREIQAAVDHPSRRKSDRVQDEQRRAAAVLSFFGIERGMTVLDMYSGGGYYTELLSYVVGDSGRVVAHNNQPYLSYAKEGLTARYDAGRLPNVEQLIAENNELNLEPQLFDAVLLIKAYHDLYYVDEDAGWAKVDIPTFLAEIFAALKSGGVLGIVDHNAVSGSPASTGGSLHRIDPILIKRDVTAAGFIYAGETSVLRNPEDDLTQTVFADVRVDKTDRSVIRFWKP
jgi:predicted methyltransferase